MKKISDAIKRTSGSFKKSFWTVALLAVVALATLTACASGVGTATPSPEDVRSMKATKDGRIPVTVMLRSAFTINVFEQAAEEKFPQLDIIQDGYYTAATTALQLETRLRQDDLGDIVMTWPLQVGEQYWDERLIDLSGMALTSAYNIGSLNEIARDGKLFFIPGPTQVRGIVYNKTLFQENDWEVPETFEEFVALCQKIEESGIRSLQLGLGNTEVLDTAFVGYSYGYSYAKPEDAQWLAEYNEGIGSFGDHFGPALDTFQTLIDAGILQKNDLNLRYPQREKMFFNRECAMIEDSVQMARTFPDRYGSTDEFALMPFLNPGENGAWVRLYPVCYIGLNQHLTEPQNKEKYALILQLMDYISTPEGQEALMGDTEGMYSNLSGMPAPAIPEMQDLLPTLEHGRCATFPTLKNAQNALRKGLVAMISGEATKADVIQMVDAENTSPSATPPPVVLGYADKNFSLTETGNFISDIMRGESGCEIALLLDNGKDGQSNNKGITAKLYAGEITEADIQRIMPILPHGEKGELVKVSMTGENLIKTLEHSVTVSNQVDWFYYFSGLRLSFIPTSSPGKRIVEITDENGKAIDPQRVYTIGIMDGSVPEENCQSVEGTGVIIKDLLIETIRAQKTISPSMDGRFKICEPSRLE